MYASIYVCACVYVRMYEYIQICKYCECRCAHSLHSKTSYIDYIHTEGSP